MTDYMNSPDSRFDVCDWTFLKAIDEYSTRNLDMAAQDGSPLHATYAKYARMRMKLMEPEFTGLLGDSDTDVTGSGVSRSEKRNVEQELIQISGMQGPDALKTARKTIHATNSALRIIRKLREAVKDSRATESAPRGSRSSKAHCRPRRRHYPSSTDSDRIPRPKEPAIEEPIESLPRWLRKSLNDADAGSSKRRDMPETTDSETMVSPQPAEFYARQMRSHSTHSRHLRAAGKKAHGKFSQYNRTKWLATYSPVDVRSASPDDTSGSIRADDSNHAFWSDSGSNTEYTSDASGSVRSDLQHRKPEGPSGKGKALADFWARLEDTFAEHNKRDSERCASERVGRRHRDRADASRSHR